MSNTSPLVELLDRLDELPDAAAARRRSYDELRAAPGTTVADVGCGTGRAVAELTDLGVHAVGIDVDDAMLALAEQRYPSHDFRQASAERLPIADGALAGYRADKVYHALPDPAAAAAEALRVLRPGGRMALLGQDWDVIAVDSDHPALTRAVVQARADTMAHPRVARAYRALLLDTGFVDVSLTVLTGVFTDPAMVLPMLTGFAANVVDSGAVPEVDATRWLADQRERARTDRLLVAVPLFLASATRP